MKTKPSAKYFVMRRGEKYFIVGDQGDLLPGSFSRYEDADARRVWHEKNIVNAKTVAPKRKT